jgi:hypothetical protein
MFECLDKNDADNRRPHLRPIVPGTTPQVVNNVENNVVVPAAQGAKRTP